MSYNITVYEPIETNPDFRFNLGTSGENPLFVIGLNPSTADDKIPDMTIKRVMSFANKHGCDSFIMLNLYPQRTTEPAKLHSVIDSQLHKENLYHILKSLEGFNHISILASWGETIIIRTYLKECLSDIYDKTKNKNISWLKIGELTQSGHPRHPSRAAYIPLSSFDIKTYIETL
jgi:hypothetical protein